MKTRTALPLTLAGLALAAAAAHAQTAPAAAAQPPAGEAAERPSRDTSGGLRFNFRGAPLETVLNYLSEAAGFVIVLETPVRGNVDMWSAQPVSKTEAVQLLNMAINKSGYTAALNSILGTGALTNTASPLFVPGIQFDDVSRPVRYIDSGVSVAFFQRNPVLYAPAQTNPATATPSPT